MTRDIFPLPPKMALKFQERAKRGEATTMHGAFGAPGTCYIFDEGREEVVLVGLDPPDGYMKRKKVSP